MGNFKPLTAEDRTRLTRMVSDKGRHAVAFWDAHASMLGALDASTADILRALLRPLAGGAIKRCPDPRATCVFLVLAWDFPSLYEEPDCYDHHPSLQLDRPPVVGGKAL